MPFTGFQGAPMGFGIPQFQLPGAGQTVPMSLYQTAQGFGMAPTAAFKPPMAAPPAMLPGMSEAGMGGGFNGGTGTNGSLAGIGSGAGFGGFGGFGGGAAAAPAGPGAQTAQMGTLTGASPYGGNVSLADVAKGAGMGALGGVLSGNPAGVAIGAALGAGKAAIGDLLSNAPTGYFGGGASSAGLGNGVVGRGDLMSAGAGMSQGQVNGLMSQGTDYSAADYGSSGDSGGSQTGGVDSSIGGLYAQGGVVTQGTSGTSSHKLTESGLINSPTGGKADAVHVGVPLGTFIIPAAAMAKLGDGNNSAGWARFRDSVPQIRAPQPVSGHMNIRVSGGEGAVLPSLVAAIGRGNYGRGVAALQALVSRLKG